MRDKTIIIAEAGVNHNGSLANAFKLVDAAVNAGADFVKFQTFKAEKLVSKVAPKAMYQNLNDRSDSDSQLSMLKSLELSSTDHFKIVEYCKKKNINFFSTAFDLESLRFLSDLGLKLVKIPSGELTNLPYLKLCAQLFEKIILSTGMADMLEIENSLSVLLENGAMKKDICILHCNTEYPTPMEDVNLRAMLAIKDKFGVDVGYSDHTLGIEVPIAAVTLGAKIIEKHFTLDKNLKGPDHAASLNPEELIAMVKAIRNIELATGGSGLKKPSKSELKNLMVARKSIHICKSLKAGSILLESDLIMLRPGDGISPMNLDLVIGKKITIDIEPGHKLSFKDLE